MSAILDQEGFISLSKERVNQLNGLGTDNNVCEAWRDGYIYALNQIYEIYFSDSSDEDAFAILDNIEEKISEVDSLEIWEDAI